MLNFSVFMILDSPFFWAHWFLKSVWSPHFPLVSCRGLVSSGNLWACRLRASGLDVNAALWKEHRTQAGRRWFQPCLKQENLLFPMVAYMSESSEELGDLSEARQPFMALFFTWKVRGWNRLVFSEAPAQSSAVMTGLYTFHGKRFHARPVGISEGLLET